MIGRERRRRLDVGEDLRLQLLGQRDVRSVVVVVAAVAAIAFGARLFFGKGFDVETVAALITALFCLVLLALPRLMFGPPIHVPWSWPGRCATSGRPLS